MDILLLGVVLFGILLYIYGAIKYIDYQKRGGQK